MQSTWKEASTLILIALNKRQVCSDWNYTLLTLKRSCQSSFMPSGYVFPGGTIEPGDGDKAWLDLLSSFKPQFNYLKSFPGKMSPILQQGEFQIPKILLLKITAIRETFEETGILLCTCSKGKSTDPLKWGSFSLFEDLDSWRKKVQKDASEFFNLCLKFNCCPDVNSLHLWSNWLTPTSKGSKRFDAAFFISCLRERPIAVADKTEIENLSWLSPEKLVALNKGKDIWLPPPQFYEISRVLQFKQIEALNRFASNRSAQGCERWMPVQMKTSDGMVSVLPGDDAYGTPDYSTPTKQVQVKMTSQEFRNQFKILHRMELIGPTVTKIVVKNYNPSCGHILPVVES